MPATCSFCDQEMKEGTSCFKKKLVEFEGGELRRPVLVGDGQDWTEGICHDCNAPSGGTHHPGCDTERCPKCGGQLISCSCDVLRDVNPNSRDDISWDGLFG